MTVSPKLFSSTWQLRPVNQEVDSYRTIHRAHLKMVSHLSILSGRAREKICCVSSSENNIDIEMTLVLPYFTPPTMRGAVSIEPKRGESVADELMPLSFGVRARERILCVCSERKQSRFRDDTCSALFYPSYDVRSGKH
jgi:hypothetical protein